MCACVVCTSITVVHQQQQQQHLLIDIFCCIIATFRFYFWRFCLWCPACVCVCGSFPCVLSILWRSQPEGRSYLYTVEGQEERDHQEENRKSSSCEKEVYFGVLFEDKPICDQIAFSYIHNICIHAITPSEEKSHCPARTLKLIRHPLHLPPLPLGGSEKRYQLQRQRNSIYTSTP